MKNNKNNLLKGITQLLLSQIFIKIIGLLYKLYLTNKDGFGDTGNAIYSSGFQIYALLLTFSSTGVPNAISKLISERIAIEDYKGAERIFKIALVTFGIIGTVGSILLFIGADVISKKWIQIPEAELSLMALAPSVFFVSEIAVIRGYFNGLQKFSYTAKSQSIEQIFKTFLTIVLVETVVFIRRKNITIMAASANLATTLATLISLIYIFFKYKSKKYILQSTNYKPLRIRKTIKKIILVAFPISLSSLIASFNKNIDSFTIVRYLKNIITEEEAKLQYGILSGKIDSLCSLPFSINVAFVTTLVPSIANEIAQNNYKETSKKSKMFILISILISLPITAIMFIFSEQILNILFPMASEGSIYLKWNSLSIIFMLVAQTINAILQAMGKVKIPPIAFGIGMIIKFICNIILIKIKRIGILGAIIGNIACNIIAFIIGFIFLKSNMKIKFEFNRFILKPIISTILMSFTAITIHNSLKCINSEICAIILTLIPAILIYIASLFILKIIKKEDIKSFIVK